MERISWSTANQTYLTAALVEVRHALERYAGDAEQVGESHTAHLNELAAGMSPAPALETLCDTFGLSTFERQVVLLCAGVELDTHVASLVAGTSGQTGPTFSLALAVFPEAHWSAVTPAAPLRYWRLIDLSSASSLMSSPLHIDERVLHYLAGVRHLDEQLMGFVAPVRASDEVVPSHRAIADHLVAAWTRADSSRSLPAIQLCGVDTAAIRGIAAYACAAVGFDLHVMPAEVVPTGPHEFDVLLRLWERESVLRGGALLLECNDMAGDAAHETIVTRFIDSLRSPLIVAGRERRRSRQRSMVTFDVRKPTTTEQRDLWDRALGVQSHALNGHVDQIVSQFDLAATAIDAACTSAFDDPGTGTAVSAGRLWDACRQQARPRLDDLAQRIEPAATWNELVLPELQLRMLRDIALHVRHRMTVYERWGFAARSSRGLGISALFAGASGTGKTMAAEVLANELRLDLYHIDLSQVVSKYIGETEKNLRRVFDAAEEGGAILLFDEADALFGKRSEVKDSHDRYANIEVGYLLQRMEAYRGLAILTTNMKSALDSAFVRRIRFIVQFPFPTAGERAEIWRHIFPDATPTKNLNVERLAQLNVAGGNIRNIALQAAFFAADAGEPVTMTHLLRAVRAEYTKLEKSLTDNEIRGWTDK